MKRATRLIPVIIFALTFGVGGALGGCSDNDVAVTPPPPPPPVAVPPPPPPTIKSQFGAGFEATFNADRFAEPEDPLDGFIIALDVTADPIDIPDP